MPDSTYETFGFGPVEEFTDTAITDRAELDKLEKRLKRPRSARAEAARGSAASNPSHPAELERDKDNGSNSDETTKDSAEDVSD
jgi:hypothetical protein